MKIAYFGGDWYMDCLDVFTRHGHSISHIFIYHERPYNQKLRTYAALHNIPVAANKPSHLAIERLKEEGVDCIFSAEYAWLIPIKGTDIKSINIHPTLLPDGRGPTPLIWILKDYPQYAGITFHQLSEQFDQGDIIYQKPIELTIDESWETLAAKLAIYVPIMLDELLLDFLNYYHSARKQGTGSYWPKIELQHRTISWNSSIKEINKLARSCGRFGVVANVEGQIMLVNQILVSQCQHQRPPGVVIREDEETYVVSASDGIVILMKHNIIERLIETT